MSAITNPESRRYAVWNHTEGKWIDKAERVDYTLAVEAMRVCNQLTEAFGPDSGFADPTVYVVRTSIADCGHEVTPTKFTTGTAHFGSTEICTACADDVVRAEMAKPEITSYVMYVSGNERFMTTWTGGIVATITRHTSARWAGTWIHHYRAETPDGSRWYGKGSGAGMAINMRKAVTR